jgi:hypothetical protein
MKTQNLKKYSVRVPGCTCWTSSNSLRVARKEQAIANRVCQPGHVVVDNETGEVVW